MGPGTATADTGSLFSLGGHVDISEMATDTMLIYGCSDDLATLRQILGCV